MILSLLLQPDICVALIVIIIKDIASVIIFDDAFI